MSDDTTPGRTAAYLRISEDTAGLELGIERQREDCRDLCHRRGWPAPVEYADNDISATNGAHRPGYAALVAAIERGDVTRVVVWHPSRIWRNRVERANGIEVMKTYRVTLACVKGPDLDMSTAYGRGLAGLVGEFDTMESEVKSERIKAKVRQLAQAGQLNGNGTRLYGYAADGVTVIPEEAQRVRSWFARLIAGESIASLARDAGCKHSSTMRGRLCNPRYAGLRVYEGREYPAAWPAIVDRSTWEAACAILADPGRTTNGGNTERKNLGSGLYMCERCETRRVYSAYYSARGKSRHVYRCRPELGGCCRSWTREYVDAYVVAAVEERLGRGDLADLLPVDRPDLDALSAEAAGIRSRRRTLARDYVALGLDEADVREAVEAGNRRLAQIEATLAGQVRGGALAELVTHEDPVALWRSIPVDKVSRRQAIVRAVMSFTLGAAPRGNPWQGRSSREEVVAWYGDRCVKIGPPAEA